MGVGDGLTEPHWLVGKNDSGGNLKGFGETGLNGVHATPGPPPESDTEVKV